MSSMRTPNRPGRYDAGLDREAHSRLEFTGLSLDHLRRLVRGEANSVARPMDELIAVTDVGNQHASDAVDLLTGNPGTHCLERDC